MAIPATRDESLERIRSLVHSFKQNEHIYCTSSSKYNETQVRTEFITPLLEAFGWDVYNTSAQSLDLREVIEEAAVEVGEEKLSKKPDYELRVARQRKFFVEAKKPSLNIEKDKAASFQVRRYGFSASLPVSVLTNFRQLAIYDCFHVPREEDEAHVARVHIYSYEEFEARFDELYEQLSRDSIYSGLFDEIYSVGVTRCGTRQFDGHFLNQVRDWRVRLACDIHKRNSGLSSEQLTYIVQLFLTRIVFLRICEDRDIEKYETLRALGEGRTFESLMNVLKEADSFYDSGLFDLMLDKKTNVEISDDVLRQIIEELYYPKSPYTFSVVEAGVLGEIYEVFLGEVIQIDEHRDVKIIEKAEVREGGGVVPTPQFIVIDILDRTLTPLLDGKGPDDLKDFTIADICCGSGVFLLGAYDILLNHHLDWYVRHKEKGGNNNIYEVGKGQWRLPFKEKKRILLQYIRGVDIDSNAVEIARFSLLLKLIEDETAEGLRAYIKTAGEKVLPSLDGTIRSGNSLLGHENMPATGGSDALIDKVNPFTWRDEFPMEMKQGGFDLIVGNPPYIRIQNMVHYSPEEVDLYRNESSRFETAVSGNFDKYSLFIERSLALVKPIGTVGLIVPHKFMTTAAGQAVRKLIADHKYLKELVHFGAQQVFGTSTSNYTCIIVLDKSGRDSFAFEKVDNLVKWRYGKSAHTETIKADQISANAWDLCPAAANIVFEKVRGQGGAVLSDIADISVGLQTSNDSVYIFSAKLEEKDHLVLDWNGKEWRIEKGILRPCLHDVQLTAYTRPQSNKYMIFPYRIKDGRAHLIQPAQMAKEFPGALSYLSARRQELEKRNITGGPVAERQWYQYGRSQSLNKFDGSKIILQVLSLEPRCTFDDQDIVVTGGGNGPYYLIRPRSGDTNDLYFLLAVLCHPLSEAMVRSRTSVFRGGYYSHGKQFIKPLPVPQASEKQKIEIAALVKQAIKISEDVENAITPQELARAERNWMQKKKIIEVFMTDLYGLSEEEMQAINDVPIPE